MSKAIAQSLTEPSPLGGPKAPEKVQYDATGAPLKDEVLIPYGPPMHCVYSSAAAAPSSGGASAAPSSSTFELFVGDVNASRDLDLLKAAGITTIINCCAASVGTCPRDWCPFPDTFNYGLVHSHDYFWQDPELRTEWEIECQNPSAQWKAVIFLAQEAFASGGKVLIHCHWGINRSSTTAAVVLVALGMFNTFDAALSACKAKRPQIDPLGRYISWGRAYCDKLVASRKK